MQMGFNSGFKGLSEIRANVDETGEHLACNTKYWGYFFAKYKLNPKQQLSMERKIQHSTTRWQCEYYSRPS